MRLGDFPVVVVGVLRELVFRWRDGEPNAMAWRNQIVAVPSALVAARMQGDRYERVDRMTFKIPELGLMEGFARDLASLLKANHRQQDDVRIDDIAARMRKRQSQGQVYNLIFMLSGILSLVGGGMVNVNIQLASLSERVREVGVRMAIGASGGEVFKGFMTEAMLLTGSRWHSTIRASGYSENSCGSKAMCDGFLSTHWLRSCPNWSACSTLR